MAFFIFECLYDTIHLHEHCLYTNIVLHLQRRLSFEPNALGIGATILLLGCAFGSIKH